MTSTTAPVAVVPDPDVVAKRRGLRRGSAGKAEMKQSGQKRAGLSTRIVMVILCLLWVVPTVGTIVTSFRTTDAALNSGWWTFFSGGFFRKLTLSNYDQVLNGGFSFSDAYINSLAISLPATIIPILFAAFAAYAFTFMQFWGREVLFVTIVALLVVPNQVALVPMLKLYISLGINGTFASVWLFHAAFAMPLAIYIFRNYMMTLPREIIESAKIDGASHMQTFWRLIVPMSTPVLASFAIFQFLWVWNDLLVALVFIGAGNDAPLPVALQSVVGQLNQGWQLVTAGGVLMVLVPLAVFLSLQRFFVRGLTSGSVKG